MFSVAISGTDRNVFLCMFRLIFLKENCIYKHTNHPQYRFLWLEMDFVSLLYSEKVLGVFKNNDFESSLD